MKGGIYLKEDYTRESAFIYFIQNSVITFLSKGTYGVTFKCVLNDGIESPYIKLRPFYKDNDVRIILIKLSSLHVSEKLKFNFNYKIVEKKINIESTLIEDFKNEIDIQNDIFDKTKELLDPICPSILYSNDNLKNQKIIIDTLYKSNENDFNNCNFIKILNNLKYVKDIDFGLIAMEMMDDYNVLNKYDKSDYDSKSDEYYTVKYIENMARLRIIQLAVRTGYSHNDYHKGNILVKFSRKTGFYEERSGHVILIDFGFSKKIPKKLFEEIKELYDKNEFKQILDIFYKNTDKQLISWLDYDKYEQYKWINSVDNHDIEVIKLLKDKYDNYENEKTLKKEKVEEKKEDYTLKRKREGEGEIEGGKTRKNKNKRHVKRSIVKRKRSDLIGKRSDLIGKRSKSKRSNGKRSKSKRNKSKRSDLIGKRNL
jgi:hypothetical protein